MASSLRAAFGVAISAAIFYGLSHMMGGIGKCLMFFGSLVEQIMKHIGKPKRTT
ncbi:hypothetical protein ACFX5U_15455 [Sphingobacterium sp. SG20118]|uniref:hypothetical protein n=1 Tax=Sphingobacterium sp. SG20118 TaxID=3367156 RepID=UPI0037DFC0FC